MLAATVKLTAWPCCQVWAGVGADSIGAEAGVDTVKVSEPESPLVSVAVTLMLNPLVRAGTVPLKVRDVALNVSQEGSVWPLASVAV